MTQSEIAKKLNLTQAAVSMALNRHPAISEATRNRVLELAGKCGYRFDVQGNRYGNPISYCWDVVATVYLLHPELYEDKLTPCFITESGMHAGWLGVTKAARDTVVLNLPQVKDMAAYRQEMYAGWLDFTVREDCK
jgi:inosine-uridine nucleoside N-ribohydrolase